jgi:hypothetical protein
VSAALTVVLCVIVVICLRGTAAVGLLAYAVNATKLEQQIQATAKLKAVVVQ